MADDEMRDEEAADDLDPAFDSIDATMKDGARRNIKVTPEKLAQIVNEAVEKAITAYEQSRGSASQSGDTPQQLPGVQPTPQRAKFDQLKDELGIDEIQFDGPRPEPVEKVIARELSSQMGVHDFEFEDAPGAAAELDAPTRTEADAMAGWALRAHDAAPATPVVGDTPGQAEGEQETAAADLEFDWVAEELKRLEADEVPTAVDLEPPPLQTPEPVRDPVKGSDPLELLARGQTPATKPAVPESPGSEKLSTLASWFRSALGDKSPAREPAAAAAMPEPVEPAMPAAAAPPEPAVAAPPVAAAPVVASRPEEPPPPARDPAPSTAVTAEDTTETVRFTFDPIPPVPPRLPREAKEPPRKINKSGTFL